MRAFSGLSIFRAWICVAALAFLAVFLFYPLSLVLHASLQADNGAWSITAYLDTLSNRHYLRSLTNSLVAGALAMIGASIIGVPLAFCFARLPLPGKVMLLTLSSLPLLLPSFVSAQARGFRQLLLRGIEKVTSEWAILCTAHNIAKLAACA